MGKHISYMLMAVVVAVIGATMLKKLDPAMSDQATSQEAGQSGMPMAAVATAKPARAKNTTRRNPLEGRIERIRASRNGHFYTSARMNGHRIKVLLDTGATSIAMDEDAARRMGIRLRKSDFRHKTKTANGVARIAVVKLDEVRIGRISVTNVDAAVVERGKLDVVLLGMSFLNKLKSFQVSDGQLVLTQ